MTLTEEEAKTKWCPEARMLVDATGYGAGNRFSGQQHPLFVAQTRCIGSACMAWRWHGDSPAFQGAGPDDELNPAGRRGYCGKAGVP